MRILENPVVIVALIVLVIVLFGAKRLPDVARSVGSSLKIFKKEVKDLRDGDGDDDRPAPTSQGETRTQQAPQAQPAPETVRPPAGDGTTPSGSSSTTS